MTSNHTPRNVPKRVANLGVTHPEHGAKADHVATLLTAGDPLADAVIAELALLGPQARQALEAGLRHGLASLGPKPPAAIAALLAQLETTPPRLDPLMLHRGDTTSLSVPPMWFGLCSITSALAHTYTSPATGRLLAQEGSLTEMAARRLAETGVWARQTIRPAGLLRGGPGYVATVEVRLRHARMRARTLTDWDMGVAGLPLGQLDMTRTWLGFTLNASQCLNAVGIDSSPEEVRHLYQYWSYVAHLLGLDEGLYEDVVDHADANRLLALLDAMTPCPDENSMALTAAMVDAQARAMAGAPGCDLSEEQLRHLIHSVLQTAFGTDWGDRLGIPEVPTETDLIPLISQLNRQARYWQTYSPASAQQARSRASAGPGPELTATVLPCGTSCRHATGVDRPSVRAA